MLKVLRAAYASSHSVDQSIALPSRNHLQHTTGNLQAGTRATLPSPRWKQSPQRAGSSERVRPCRSRPTARAQATTTSGPSGSLPETASSPPDHHCCRCQSLCLGARPDQCRRHCAGGRGYGRAGGRSRPSTWGRASWAAVCSAPSSRCSSRMPQRARTPD